MSWNYRVIRAADALGESWGIHEVHYGPSGQPEFMTTEPASLVSEQGLMGLKAQLEKMEKAIDLPILNAKDMRQVA